MMNQETRVAIINKEIEVYESYIALIPIMEEVIRKFDNKCINKKFQTALDESVNNGKTGQERKFHVTTNYGYNGRFEIEVRAYNDGVKEITDKEYPNYYRVENNRYIFEFPKEVFEVTDSGNYRIKADAILECLANSTDNLLDKIDVLRNGLVQANEMIAEMKRIKSEVEAFEKKYNYHMRNVMGVNFTLRSNCGMGYTRYDI